MPTSKFGLRIAKERLNQQEASRWHTNHGARGLRANRRAAMKYAPKIPPRRGLPEPKARTPIPGSAELGARFKSAKPKIQVGISTSGNWNLPLAAYTFRAARTRAAEFSEIEKSERQFPENGFQNRGFQNPGSRAPPRPRAGAEPPILEGGFH